MDQCYPSVIRNIFQRLPTELVLEVLKKCSDFTALWCLITASPDCLAVFKTAALDIIEAVIDSTMYQDLHILMRAVLRMRLGTFYCPSPEDIRQAWGVGSISWDEHLSRPSSTERTSHTDALLTFVRRSSNVHAQARSCLDECYERFSSYRAKLKCRTDIQKLPQSPTNGLRTPSWVEDMRALATFWRLQFYQDLKLAAGEGHLKWSLEDLRSMSQWDIGYCDRSTSHGMEAKRYVYQTAARFLVRRQAVPASQSTSLFEAEWKYQFGWPGGVRNNKDSQAVDEESFAVRMLEAARKTPNRGVLDTQAELARVFECGFAFWDEETMIELGLHARGRPLGDPNIFLDMLSKDEVERLEGWELE